MHSFGCMNTAYENRAINRIIYLIAIYAILTWALPW